MVVTRRNRPRSGRGRAEAVDQRRTRRARPCRGRCCCSPRTHSSAVARPTGTTTCSAMLEPGPSRSRGLAVHERGQPQPVERGQARDQLAGVDLHAARLAGHEEDQVEADVHRRGSVLARAQPTAARRPRHRRPRRRRGAGRARPLRARAAARRSPRCPRRRSTRWALRPDAWREPALDGDPGSRWRLVGLRRSAVAPGRRPPREPRVRRVPVDQLLPDRVVHRRCRAAVVLRPRRRSSMPDAPEPRAARHRAGDDPPGAAARRRADLHLAGDPRRPRRPLPGAGAAAATPLAAAGRLDAPLRRPARRARRGSTPAYVLAVGTLEPRKNLPRLVEAFAALPDELRAAHPLALVGPPGWDDEDDARGRRARAARRCRLLGLRLRRRRCTRSTPARPSSPTRRSTRASACRCSRRWPPARPW